jgi:hypothetical protein
MAATKRTKKPRIETPANTKRVRPIEGEFYFVIKIEPANAQTPIPRFGPRFVGTIHKAENTTALKGTDKRLLVVEKEPKWQSKRAFKFVVQDMNSDLDTLDLTKTALREKGDQWREDSVDVAIFRVVIGKDPTASPAGARRRKGKAKS